jgi:[ribosomal protein S5]-alanine N-acetyltransferase
VHTQDADVVLQTPRLLLRRATMADLDDIHALLSDPVAMRYWSSAAHTEVDQSRGWLESMVNADLAISDDFVIEHDGAVIGKAGCWRLPEIGYILRREHWRKGLAFEALSAVIESIFRRHKIDAIRADVDPRNEASLALLQKLGFIETHRAERTWYTNDEWCDSVYLKRLRDCAGNTTALEQGKVQ